jgi:hypothetical protein
MTTTDMIQLRFMATALARQACIRIGLRFMRVVTPDLSVKVHRRVFGIVRWRRFGLIFALKALLARPCFDQGPIHAEVLIGKPRGLGR